MISLTFDDGLPCHYQTVIPELNARGMKATFFVPIIPQDGENEEILFDVRFRDEEWKNALAWGHEIGGHSVRHRKPEYTPSGEIPGCQRMLRDVLGVEPRSYAYPFCQTNTEHLKVVARHFDQARGGEVQSHGFRFNYPSRIVGDWNIDRLDGDGVYTFHGIGQPGAWGNIALDQFRRFLDKLKIPSLTFADYMKESL